MLSTWKKFAKQVLWATIIKTVRTVWTDRDVKIGILFSFTLQVHFLSCIFYSGGLRLYYVKLWPFYIHRIWDKWIQSIGWVILTSDVRITRKKSSSQCTFPITITYITRGANLGNRDAIPDLWYELNIAVIHVHFPRGHINPVILYYCGFCTGCIGMTWNMHWV